ncbi:hypothetical protein D3C76_1378450 [compost metagenome]
MLHLVAYGGKSQQRDRGAIGGDDLQVLQGLRRATFAVLGTGHDIDQVDIVIHLGHRHAADDAVHHIGHVLGRQAQLARLVLGDLDPQHLAWLVPVINHLADVIVAVQQGCQRDGMLAHLIDVLAADPILDWQAHRWAHFQ